MLLFPPQVLINVGPSKPARKLPEAERKALLSTNETPESTLDTTPPHKLYLETSFTNANPGEVLEAEVLNRSSGAFSIISDANSLSWDYASPLDVERRAQNLEKIERQDRTKSLPPPQHPRPDFKLDLSGNLDEWSSPAPLATPETLSDTSSIDSGSWKGSRKFTNGYQRLTTGMPTMEPIQQSPLRTVRSEGYHYFIEAPSPVEYHESPEREFGTLAPPEHSLPQAQSTPLKNQITTEVTVESDIPPSKPPRTNLNFRLNPEVRKEGGSTDTSFDLSAEEDKLQEKLTKSDSMNNYKLAFENESIHKGSMEYIRHSPDEYGNQLVYDTFQGHYSHAGRGYPHGGYMSDDLIEDESTDTLLNNKEDEESEGTKEMGIGGVVDFVPEGGVSREGEGLEGQQSLLNPATDLLVDSTNNDPQIIDTNRNHNTKGLDLPLQAQNGLPLVHTACTFTELSVPGRPRLKPFTSHDRARSSTPEDEYGRRLSQATSDDVFILDTANEEETTNVPSVN